MTTKTTKHGGGLTKEVLRRYDAADRAFKRALKDEPGDISGASRAARRAFKKLPKAARK